MLKYLLIAGTLLLPTLAPARWIEDIVIFENEDYGHISFSHYQHLEILGKDCGLCHNQVFHIDPQKNPAYSMDEMAQGKSCGACHNGDQAFTVEENCDSCHSE